MLWFVVLSDHQVEVNSGAESVKLPCKTRINLPKGFTAEWTNGNKVKLHMYPTNDPKEQHQGYRGRTEMKRNPLGLGDFSLTLKYPTDMDRDIFTCTAYNSEKNVLMKERVLLKVKGEYCSTVINKGRLYWTKTTFHDPVRVLVLNF